MVLDAALAYPNAVNTLEQLPSFLDLARCLQRRGEFGLRRQSIVMRFTVESAPVPRHGLVESERLIRLAEGPQN